MTTVGDTVGGVWGEAGGCVGTEHVVIWAIRGGVLSKGQEQREVQCIRRVGNTGDEYRRAV